MMIMLIMICDDYDGSEDATEDAYDDYDDYVDHDGGDDANLDDDQDNDDDDDVRKGMSILHLYYPLLPSPVLRPRLLRAYFKNTDSFMLWIPKTSFL